MQTTRKYFTGTDDRRRENSYNDQREFSRGTSYPGAVLRFIDFENKTRKLIYLMGRAIESHPINESSRRAKSAKTIGFIGMTTK